MVEDRYAVSGTLLVGHDRHVFSVMAFRLV